MHLRDIDWAFECILFEITTSSTQGVVFIQFTENGAMEGIVGLDEGAS